MPRLEYVQTGGGGNFRKFLNASGEEELEMFIEGMECVRLCAVLALGAAVAKEDKASRTMR